MYNILTAHADLPLLFPFAYLAPARHARIANVLERTGCDKPSLRSSRQRALFAYRRNHPKGLHGFNRMSDRSKHFAFRDGG